MAARTMADGVRSFNRTPWIDPQLYFWRNARNVARYVANTKSFTVYTCQQAQPKRCDFFLWEDDAKHREAAAVLSNSRTEPLSTPRTPRKPAMTSYGLQTPHTGTSKGHRSPEPFTPYTPAKSSGAAGKSNDTQDTSTTLTASDEEFYDWPASDEEDVLKAADQASSKSNMRPPETPSKAARTELLTTPGKRRFSQIENGRTSMNAWPTPSDTDGDVFTTPSTNLKVNGILAPWQTISSPSDTPTPRRFTDMLQAGHDSELTSEVLRVLQDSKMPINSDVKAEIKIICDRHALSTRGILKGRDISRAMVNAKNAKISELQENIVALQAERETNRAVIRHLRRDMELAKHSDR
ncbi:MAG: hypothetical protein Q9208_008591 [Pyrenodesmia sp. 3 TL-2023]